MFANNFSVQKLDQEPGPTSNKFQYFYHDLTNAPESV